MSLTFDEATGKLKQMQNLERGITLPLIQDYLYYVGHPGNNSRPKFQASGAYIFRPNITATHQSRAALKRKSYVLQVCIVRIVFNSRLGKWCTEVSISTYGKQSISFSQIEYSETSITRTSFSRIQRITQSHGIGKLKGLITQNRSPLHLSNRIYRII